MTSAPRDYLAGVGERSYKVRIGPDGDGIRVEVDGAEHKIGSFERDTRGVFLLLDGAPHRLELHREAEGRYRVHGETTDLLVTISDPVASRARRSGVRSAAERRTIELRAPMPGLVVSVGARVGARVEPEDALVVLEAMKMQNALASPSAGIVREVRVSAGQTVEGDSLLVVLERAEEGTG